MYSASRFPPATFKGSDVTFYVADGDRPGRHKHGQTSPRSSRSLGFCGQEKEELSSVWTHTVDGRRAGYEHQNKNETEGEKVLKKEKEQAGEAQKKKSHSGRPRREHLSAV